MFVEIPATKLALSQRKLIFGVGVNDASYIVTNKKNGKQTICPYYMKWKHMIKRCYSEKFQTTRPTYIGCTVTEEWHSFMKFRAWMKTQDWKGKQLDKDILIVGNKVYSPNACAFVPISINSLITHVRSNNGGYPAGVCFHKDGINNFVSYCQVNGKRKHLGRFATPEEAGEAYKKAKRKDILAHANIQDDNRIRQGLTLHAEAL